MTFTLAAKRTPRFAVSSLFLSLSAALFSQNLFAEAIATEENPNFSVLSEQPEWLKLGHYVDKLGGWESQIDSGRFFLSKKGKTSPESELAITYKTFVKEQQSGESTVSCQYPARFRWLNRVLSAGWNMPVCPALDQWKTVIDPEGVTLVFPTAFMNNPSSMFGHTLLRVDAKDQTRNKELVAFAINFAAEPDAGDNAAAYAIKGLVGSYPSAFSLMPYYRKVREYNDLESRDIWEYKLNLAPEEVETILYHLWELQDARFDYYFLDENCSYQLLSLLQVARDDLMLTAEFPLHAIPSDTVSVLKNKGLINPPAYRPAFGTRLNHYAGELDDVELGIALALSDPNVDAEQEMPPGTDSQKAGRLEFAYESLNFRFYDERLNRDVVAPKLTGLLMARSRLDVGSPFSQVPRPDDSSESGHGSMRVGLGYYGAGEENSQITFHWRAAYHDMLDRPGGFIPGAQISFLDMSLGIDKEGDITLNKLYLLDAMSLAPDNRIFSSWSWNVRAGSDRQPVDNGWENRWFFQGGYGKSWGSADKLHGYLLASSEVDTGSAVSRNASFGVGVESGLSYQFANQDRVLLSGQHMIMLDSPFAARSQASLQWNHVVTQNLSVRTEAGYWKWEADDVYGEIRGYFYF
ncbi:DUF4105 domain-containing protein [Parasalinivibrio latis]|uniref:Lnb N-terminal periplasmic domain-containing protein n=1 Tax=Parasalinivibrio latis TaxID=2952610 RepID=UPI0030E56652